MRILIDKNLYFISILNNKLIYVLYLKTDLHKFNYIIYRSYLITYALYVIVSIYILIYYIEKEIKKIRLISFVNKEYFLQKLFIFNMVYFFSHLKNINLTIFKIILDNNIIKTNLN